MKPSEQKKKSSNGPSGRTGPEAPTNIAQETKLSVVPDTTGLVFLNANLQAPENQFTASGEVEK
jgi:hypothetical protein